MLAQLTMLHSVYVELLLVDFHLGSKSTTHSEHNLDAEPSTPRPYVGLGAQLFCNAMAAHKSSGCR